MKGTVKFFNEEKGYGFVTGEDGNDCFVHISGIKEGLMLEEGMKVSYDIVDGNRGKKAENVKLATGGSSSSEETEELAEVEDTTDF